MSASIAMFGSAINNRKKIVISQPTSPAKKAISASLDSSAGCR